MRIMSKIKLVNCAEFGHHRDGWRAATEILWKLHSSIGVDFYDWADREFKGNQPITKKWVGIFHNVLSYPNEYSEKYNKDRIFALSDLVKQTHFLDSMENCLGIYTLCQHTANFFRRNVDVNVEWIWHPIRHPHVTFSWDAFCDNPKVISIGQWMRKHHSFFMLQTNYPKLMPKIKGFESDYKAISNYTSLESVEFLPFLDNKSYDEIMSNSVVFLDLYDAAACNTILECIIRNTPILVNMLPSIVQYLGPKYPLYFETLDEASEKLNIKSIQKAHEYLVNKKNDHLSQDNFLNSILNSKIYQDLPTTKLF